MKTAVVLFNLGAPLNKEGVRPFLLSLFSDPAILKLPAPFRKWIAGYISWKRASKTQGIYGHLGGGSPLLENTKAQAVALESILGEAYKVFVAMRHASPLAEEILPDILRYGPSKIILLPLYPQFSTTTTGSFLKKWREKAKALNLQVKTEVFCCYPELPGFIKAYADLIRKALPLFREKPRLLFSAHGLPERIVRSGDPYVQQVEQTAAQILGELLEGSLINNQKGNPKYDPRGGQLFDSAQVCYQSRVGPLSWTKPHLDTEINRAAEEKKGVLLVPLSFVSEHSETLVELDITCRAIAQERGVLEFRRTPTVSCHPLFIQGLADLLQGNVRTKICDVSYKHCWRQTGSYL